MQLSSSTVTRLRTADMQGNADCWWNCGDPRFPVHPRFCYLSVGLYAVPYRGGRGHRCSDRGQYDVATAVSGGYRADQALPHFSSPVPFYSPAADEYNPNL